jgi:outer membrane lipoprotein LolB
MAASSALRLAGLLTLWLGACSQVPVAPSSAPLWQGRLSVTVHSEPPSSMSAGFALSGQARAGELNLYSPLGTTLAQLQWSPSSAHLHRGQEPERYASMDELTTQVTGSALPVAALFDWLQGRAATIPGWQADLSELPRGSLIARRQFPEPAVTLRVKLD